MINCRSDEHTKALRLVLYSQKLINVTERRCGRRWTGVKMGHEFQRDATHKLIRRESEGSALPQYNLGG